MSSWDEPRVGITELPAEVWGLPPRPDIVNNVVLWQRACRRLGLATSKGRAEVSGGGRKPRPQKGTGRSRLGSIRSPLWRGGGASHGPKPRDFSFKMNRKQRALGLKTALSDKYRRNALLVLDDPGLELGKTTELLKKLAGLGMSKEHRVDHHHQRLPNQSQAPLTRAWRANPGPSPDPGPIPGPNLGPTPAPALVHPTRYRASQALHTALHLPLNPDQAYPQPWT